MTSCVEDLETVGASVNDIGIGAGDRDRSRITAGGSCANQSWRGGRGDVEDLETVGTNVNDIGIGAGDSD